ncbi:Eco57I restriction-modification methylase domain-containing protein [Spirosoma pulveris]
MFDQIDTIRRDTNTALDPTRRSQLGQFMTPSRIARFMASLFTDNQQDHVSLLDAGAGVGSLSAAFLERVQNQWGSFSSISGTAYEIDPILSEVLTNNFDDYQGFALSFGVNFAPNIISDDFIESSVLQLLAGQGSAYDYAILNPPYKKINSNSHHRHLLRAAGIETVNLYTGFIALALMQMKAAGQIVAIIPRSFCNGPYYRPFRELILKHAALRHIHLFDSRNKPFGEDAVLQENIIIHLVKGGLQEQVTISTSSDDTFSDLRTTAFDFKDIVKIDDVEKFIHIPTGHEEGSLKIPEAFHFTLAQIGVDLSTGPIVDFRVKEHLRMEPEEGSVPLLYPGHFSNKHVSWPKLDFKKPNAIVLNSDTEKWLYPAGYYTVVKRFTSKEEKKRIVARVVSPSDLNGQLYGFENHLNVFHCKKRGLSEELVLGLAVYLNSSMIDQYFRQFNGHTQVNATDLRLLKYPSKKTLFELGAWAKCIPDFEQNLIDQKIGSLA